MRSLIALIVFPITLVAAVAFVLASYSSANYLLLGIAAALVLIFFVPRLYELRPRIQSITTKRFVIGAVVIVVVSALCLLIFAILVLAQSNSLAGAAGDPDCDKSNVDLIERPKTYAVAIEPQDFSTGRFKVVEELTYNVVQVDCIAHTATVIESDKALTLPERYVYSTNRGVFTREIAISPPDMFQYPLTGLACCLNSFDVELPNLPRGSFYEARNAQRVDVSRYLGTETITWQGTALEDGVTFAYFTSPMSIVRVVLTPLIAVSDSAQWVISALGLVLTLVSKSTVAAIGKNRLTSLFPKWMAKRTATTSASIRRVATKRKRE